MIHETDFGKGGNGMPGGRDRLRNTLLISPALLRRAWRAAGRDAMDVKAAALAFFTVLALFPMLILSTALLGFIFGTVKGEMMLFNRLQLILSPEGLSLLARLLHAAQAPGSRFMVSAAGVLVLLYGASSVGFHLRRIMNALWGLPPEHEEGLRSWIWDRAVSVVLSFAGGVVLFLFPLVKWVLGSLRGFLVFLAGEEFFMAFPVDLFRVLEYAGSFLFGFVLLLAVYRFVPRTRVDWGPAAFGAVVAAVAFRIGSFVLGSLLQKSLFSSIEGFLGSFVLMFLWIFYAYQALLYGAECAKALDRQLRWKQRA
jgi:membrane protein